MEDVPVRFWDLLILRLTINHCLKSAGGFNRKTAQCAVLRQA
ncbi:hypothetical protein D2M30_2128 [Bacillus amyloliquefaciens]|nr:hypothetical protein D2M30_2128 [Bacillus amyloliquefaciens]